MEIWIFVDDHLYWRNLVFSKSLKENGATIGERVSGKIYLM